MALISREDFNNAVCMVLKSFPCITQLNQHQDYALFELIHRRDVLAILPTGFGKSLIFQLLPPLCRVLNAMGYDSFPNNAIVLVICPLVALIESHMNELNKRGMSCTCLSATEACQDKEGVLKGKYSFVFANPETIIANEKWREMLQSSVYQERLFAIVTDEAHVIPKWGFGNPKEKVIAFRECFGRLGELRSLIPDCTPILAITATAAKGTRDTITKALSLRADHYEIILSPDRPNIYLHRAKVNNNLLNSFDWLLNMLRSENILCPKTLVYCKSIKDCAQLFTYFRDQLGTLAYAPDAEQVAENMLIGMYHHCTIEKHKKIITTALYSSNGSCRVVFCTNALGMGINFPDIRFVVHYGPPRNVEDFLQEIGRGGRDGKSAVAILLFRGKHLRKCDRHIKSYAIGKEIKCLRSPLLEEFGEAKSDIVGHNCYLLCHERCHCNGNNPCDKLIPFDLHNVQSESNPKTLLRKRKVNADEINLLEELLNDYQQKLISSCPCYFLSPECTTGFSEDLKKSILSKAKYIFDVEYVLDNLHVFNVQDAIDITYMCADVFGDFVVHIDEKYYKIATTDQVGSYDLEYGEMCQEVKEECLDVI